MALSGDGLFSMARKAAADTKKASEEETKILSMYEFEMEKISGNVDENETYGEYAMEQEIKEVYGQEIKIGDQVNYNPKVEGADEEVSNYTGVWKVLGIEDGKVLLMSSSAVGEVNLSGVDGYQNAERKLNEICEKYEKGLGAESARSLKVEDINRITGYNPENPTNGGKYGKGTLYEYGIEVEIKLQDGIATSTGSNGVTGSKSATNFIKPDGTELNSNGEETFRFTSNKCAYFINSAYTLIEGGNVPVDFDALDLRWENLFQKSNKNIWLANKIVEANKDGGASYTIMGLFRVLGDSSYDYPFAVSTHTIFRSGGIGSGKTCDVHCVVELRDDVKFNLKSNSMWEIEE